MTRRRQFGTVRVMKSGRWQARYYDADGTRRSAPTTFKSKTEAHRWLSLAEADLLRGTWRDPAAGRATLAAWIEQYRASPAHLRRKRRTSRTKDNCAIDKHILPALGGRRLSVITKADIQTFVDDLSARPLQPATVRTYFITLQTILSAAVDADLIARNPCKGVKLPGYRAARPPQFLTEQELHRLADSVPTEYRAMIYLAGVLGLRWSEVIGLRVMRLDLLKKTVMIAETLAEVNGEVHRADVKSPSSRRLLSLPDFLANMLAEHLSRRGLTGADGDALLFVSPDGRELRRSNFATRVLAPAVAAAGLERVTFHHLRHTAVGLLVEVNAPVAAMKERLGHGSVQTTIDIYGHVLPSTDTAVTEDLNSLLQRPDPGDEQDVG